MQTNQIITGDCFEELEQLPENSIHAVVCDPPYAFDGGFMGKDWDNFSDSRAYQEWCMEWATEVNRVLKPGGHLLAFGGNTNHHRLFAGVEDAGFEIRDTITWHYGSGFPKSLDVSKAIDKQADAEREVVGEYSDPDKTTPRTNGPTTDGQETYGDDERNGDEVRAITQPATPEAEQWDGFKTALKPATEYVVVARKELSEGTVAENVLAHGTGALNIKETRIESGERPERTDNIGESYKTNAFNQGTISNGSKATGTTTEGRYPSNVVFHEGEAGRLNEQVGELETGGGDKSDKQEYDRDVQVPRDERTKIYERTKGGPSRYFYTSKASKAERTEDGQIENTHPTVKPVDLMEWLVKLVTAENQIVLDPFVGSGTTCKAAKNLNREFIGIEKQSKWADVARVRTGLTPQDPSVVRENENQEGLEAYE